jgi:hypothetical protein
MKKELETKLKDEKKVATADQVIDAAKKLF